MADEVRKLAERTTQATREIAQMIKGIQVETTQIVEVMGKSKGSVEESIALAEKAGTSLTCIVAATEQAENMISHIAAASEQQSATSEQISRSVGVISTVSNASATGITEIVGSLEALREVTGELRALVARFHTESGMPSGDREPAARAVRQRGVGMSA